MAKFCVYCGKPLQEGEICNCRTQASQQQACPPVSPQAASQAAPNPTATTAQTYLTQLWQLIRNIYKAPGSLLKSFAASGDTHNACGLIVIRSLSFAIFMTVLCSRIGSALSDGLKGFSNNSVGKSLVQGTFDFPLANVFFLALITSFGMACLFAAILLLFNKAMFKADTDYGHMFCVSSAYGIAGVPFLLAGMILLFLSIPFGICVALAGIALQPVFTFLASEGTSQIDKSKVVYATFYSIIVLMICIFLVAQITFPMYLPPKLKNIIDLLKTGANVLSTLVDAFSGQSGALPNLLG